MTTKRIPTGWNNLRLVTADDVASGIDEMFFSANGGTAWIAPNGEIRVAKSGDSHADAACVATGNFEDEDEAFYSMLRLGFVRMAASNLMKGRRQSRLTEVSLTFEGKPTADQKAVVREIMRYQDHDVRFHWGRWPRKNRPELYGGPEATGASFGSFVRDNPARLIQHPSIQGHFRVAVKKGVTARVFRIGDGYWNWVSPEHDVHGGFDSPQEAAEAAVRAHKRKSPKRPVDPVAAKMQRDVVRRFGITSDPLEAGYVLRDGRLLDMSGKRDGGPAGTRSYDHRQAGDGSTQSMWEFMKRCGAIRVHAEDDYLGADLDTGSGFVKPSKKQIDVLTRIAATRSRPPRLVFDGGPLGNVFDIENASAFRRELERALQS